MVPKKQTKKQFSFTPVDMLKIYTTYTLSRRTSINKSIKKNFSEQIFCRPSIRLEICTHKPRPLCNDGKHIDLSATNLYVQTHFFYVYMHT